MVVFKGSTIPKADEKRAAIANNEEIIFSEGVA
jgi:hypothetical protein